MPSPFPGMDPYLEQDDIWSDFHGTFLVGLRAELNRILPKPYVARWDRHVWIDDEAGSPRVLGRPDTYVHEGTGVDVSKLSPATAIAAPMTATVPSVTPKGKPFVKIIDARGRRVVTAVEVLSPANKSSGKDREAYLAKRQEYFRNGTNLVEIDLLRGGKRPPISGVTVRDYYILVSQASEFPEVGVWLLTVRDPLPMIPVPLDSSVPPVLLPLRPSMDRAFEEARFEEEIQYDEPLSPPLDDADEHWVRSILAQRSDQAAKGD